MGVAKVCFIPHPDNDHWPLALRHRSLAYVSLFLVLTKLATIIAVTLVPTTARLSTITQERMIQLTNQARKEAGLPALSVNSALTQAAQLKGQDMLTHEYFAHISPSGITPWFWMKKTGYEYTVAGENLAIDFGEAEDVVEAWLHSPSHRANLLHEEYTETGIAVVSGQFQGGTSIIVVHMFGRPLQAGAASEEQPAAPQEQAEAPAQEAAPTAAPQATPLPTTEALPSPEATPLPAPRTPRIALAHSPKDSEDSVTFTITGESASTAMLFIENQERTSGTIPPEGTLTVTLASSSLPSGTLIARAVAKNDAGNESDPSNPISFTNPKPLAATDYSLLLSPLFDQEEFALLYRGQEAAPQLFSVRSSIATTAHVISAAPSFAIQGSTDEKMFTAAFLHGSRLAAGIITLIVAFLLAFTILIKIRVQHPALLAHASVIILFALRFLFA